MCAGDYFRITIIICQFCTISKRIVINGGYRVGDGDGGQAGATRERIPPNAGDRVGDCNGD